MADYTRLIEFKVKGTELTRATDKIFKSLNKIEISVEETNKGLAVTAKQLKNVAREANNTQKAIAKVAKVFAKLGNPQGIAKSAVGGAFGLLLNNPGKIAKAAAKLAVVDGVIRKLNRNTKGLGQVTLDLFNAVGKARQSLEGYSRTVQNLIQQHPRLTQAIAGTATSLGIVAAYTPQIYNLGKAFRQIESDIIAVDKAGRAGGLKNILRLFPKGSRLGQLGRFGDIENIQGIKGAKEVEKAAKETQKQYKLAATGLNKLTERLEKAKKVQDQLLSSSKGYVNVSKKVLSIEKEITKEQQKRAGINRKLTWGKDLMKIATGRGGLAGKAIDIVGKGIAGYGVADAAIRKLSGLLGKQVGLFQATSVAASKFWQTLQAVNQGARNAATGLTVYGRYVVNLITQHQRLIQVVGGLAVGLDAVGRFTPQIYAAGKAWRQLEYDIRRVGKAFYEGGPKGVGSLFPSGSMIGRWGRGTSASDTPIEGKKMGRAVDAAQKVYKGQAGGIRSQVDGLNKVSKILERNQKIQENINVGTKTHVQAVVAVKQAQFAYNLELLKTKTVQAVVTADIWAAKKAWQGVIGVLKGATGLLGGLLGGAAKSKLGQAAGVIGVSDAVKRLAQHIPFISQAWKDNLEVFATWTQRITEGLTAVTIAHGVFSKAIGAAQWTTGAISGFVKWEKAAFAAFHRVNKGRIDLDRNMAARLAKGENMFTGLGKWLGGGEERIEEKESVYREPTRALKITKELEKQKALLAQHNASSSKYRTIRERILKLEELQTKELNTRRRADIRGGADPEKVFADEFKEMEDALENFESTQKKIKDRAASQEDARIKRRIAEDDKANKIAMAAKQKIWNAEGKAWEQRMRWAERERLAEKKYQDQLKRRKEARKQKMGRLGENLMLGAGFPLLFGGGAGAVGGGVLGAGLQAMSGSQGFGMQILFSALGQQLDAFAGKTAELGQAFIALDKDASTLIDSLGVKGTEYERQINQLKKLGAEEEAFALARDKMLRLVGQDGINNLTRFGEETQELGNEWGKLVTQMQAGLAGLITASGALRALVDGINRQVVINQAMANVGGDQKLTDINAAIARYSSGEIRPGGIAGGSGPQAGKNVFKDFPSMKELTQQLFERQTHLNQTGADRDLKALKDANQESVLKTLQDEEKLIRNKIKYGEKEAAIKQKIAEIMKDNKDLDEKKVENAVRAIAAAEKEREQVQQLNELYEQVGQTIENGIVSAIENAITGAQSLGEVLSSVVRSIAGIYLRAGIAAMPLPFLEKKAEGGYVTGPTPSLIGEGGEPEYVIPASKMSSAMARYSAGQRGESILVGGGSSSGGATVNYSGPILSFNAEEYVPKSAVEGIIATAARQGGAMGQANTLKTLKNSRSTRSSLGI